MPRYKLRTLLIVLALGPPVLAAVVPPLIAWLNRPQPQLRVFLNGPGTRWVHVPMTSRISEVQRDARDTPQSH